MALARLSSTGLDCSDPAALAAFWAGLLGGEVVYRSRELCVVRAPGGWLSTVRVPDHRPPTWPDSSVPKQIHLDLAVEDLDAAAAEAIRLGAHLAGEQPEPGEWRVLVDPAGHPFCLTTQRPTDLC